jgi:hypothetical protein
VSVRGPKPKPLAERFEEMVRRLPGDDACWEWTGAVCKAGYGRIGEGGRGGRHLLVHRVAWELANGPIPAGMVVRHHCDNRRCVRPSHLELGSQADNLCDMAKRRRGVRSKTGLPYGVSAVNGGRRWRAQVWTSNHLHRLGTFPTIEQAAEAAERERIRLYGGSTQCLQGGSS